MALTAFAASPAQMSIQPRTWPPKQICMKSPMWGSTISCMTTRLALMAMDGGGPPGTAMAAVTHAAEVEEETERDETHVTGNRFCETRRGQ